MYLLLINAGMWALLRSQTANVLLLDSQNNSDLNKVDIPEA